MDNILNVNNISKSIQNNVILNNISFSVNKSEIMGIKGRNGSGKSMLFKALTGLIVLDSGDITICGRSICEEGVLNDIGALIEYPGFLPNFSGLKNLLLLASIKKVISEKEILDTMRRLGLDPNDKRPYRKYSLGMRQKLGIASAIMENPKLLILDEPCNNLDIESVELVRKLLKDINKKNNTTIVIASHNVEDFNQLCSGMCEIKAGKLEEL